MRYSNHVEARTQENNGIFSAIERHTRLTLATPFMIAAFFIVLRYVGGDELRRVVDFITFSPGK